MPDRSPDLRGRGPVRAPRATDDAQVVLTAPGHTVWVDPGADVQTTTATSLVTELDPRELDPRPLDVRRGGRAGGLS